MLAFLKLAFFGFIALSVIYIALSLWLRRLHRAKLKRRWAEEGLPVDRDAFVRAGLKDYDASIRPKLVFAVYIVPLVALVALIFLTNFN